MSLTLLDLPVEMRHHIYSFCEEKDIKNIRLVCRQMNHDVVQETSKIYYKEIKSNVRRYQEISSISLHICKQVSKLNKFFREVCEGPSDFRFKLATALISLSEKKVAKLVKDLLAAISVDTPENHLLFGIEEIRPYIKALSKKEKCEIYYKSRHIDAIRELALLGYGKQAIRFSNDHFPLTEDMSLFLNADLDRFTALTVESLKELEQQKKAKLSSSQLNKT